MKLDKQYWKSLAAYLSGNLEDSERSDFELKRNVSSESRKAAKEAEQIWDSSGMRLRMNDPETDSEWERLANRLENSDSENKRVVELLTDRAVWFKMAAVLVMLISVFYFFLPSNTSTPTSIKEELVVLAAFDGVLMVYLPDSSKVWLNKGSSLSYTKGFGKESRSSKLDGEAFFEVRRDTTAPFTVTTSLASVRVLGTSFNVKEGKEEVVLTVAEGKVSFSPSDPAGEKLEVTASEKAVVTEKGKLAKGINDDPHFAAWRKNNNPLYEREKLEPARFLSNDYSWEKNALNLSVIKGSLENTAELADYTNVVLKVSYTKPNGKVSTSSFTINDTVRPGQRITYHKRLFDIFTDTQKVKVEIQSAEVR